MSAIKRQFVTIGSRQVHLRRAGDGPPVVILHASPLSSAWHLDLVERLSPTFAALALDTPGYGLSDPLATAAPEIGDYAEALAETLVTLRVERAGLYGHHTGAAIALELAARRPDLVAALVVDGLPIWSAEEREELLAHYAPRFPPRWDGTHLLQAWSRQRDQYIWFPWFKREVARRLPFPMAPPEDVHRGVLDILRADTEDYPLGYEAAFRYDALPALERLDVLAAATADERDVLVGRLRDLPERLRRIPPEGIVEFLAASPGSWATSGVCDSYAQAGIVRGFADTSAGQLLTRRAGGGTGRPLVMLHASPGSSQSLEPLVREFAAQRPVVAFDTIGNGESDKPPFREPDAGDYAAVFAEAIAALELDDVDLYGTHTGAMLAIELALRHPERINRLILEGVVLFDDAQREDILANYLVPLDPQWDGSHLLRIWSVRRDSKLWWPWYQRDPDHVRPGEPATVGELHRDVTELLKSGPTYALAYRVALSYPTRDRIPGLQVPTLLAAPEDDVLYADTLEAARLLPGSRVADLPESLAERATLYSAFLDEAS